MSISDLVFVLFFLESSAIVRQKIWRGFMRFENHCSKDLAPGPLIPTNTVIYNNCLKLLLQYCYFVQILCHGDSFLADNFHSVTHLHNVFQLYYTHSHSSQSELQPLLNQEKSVSKSLGDESQSVSSSSKVCAPSLRVHTTRRWPP